MCFYHFLQYSVIILDEVHERNLYTDIVLGLLKKILKRRKRLRLVVCSATYDTDKFYNFFNFNKTKDKNDDTVALLSIEGRNFPVDIFYVSGTNKYFYFCRFSCNISYNGEIFLCEL